MKTLLLMIYLLYILHLGESYGDWQHPQYSYRCLEDEKLELFGPHTGSKIQICGKEGETGCKVNEDPTGVFWIKYSCMNGTGDDYSATVSVRDTQYDDMKSTEMCYSYTYSTTTTTTTTTTITTAPTPTPTPTKSTPSNVGGRRHHEFVITCKGIPNVGINKTVARVFQEKEYNELPVNYKEVDEVEMRFKAVNDSNAPDIISVYIGDEFYMFIKYMGKKDYTIIPEECAAYGEAWIPQGYMHGTPPAENWVELWNIHNFQSNSKGCVNHEELLEEFGRYNKTFIYAKMYGFRFANKNYVTITCQVRIFDNIAAKKDLCVEIKPLTGRRKRNIENVPFQRKTLTKKLWVLDNKDVQFNGNNGLQIKWETSLWIMIFATITFNFWLTDH